MFGHVGGLAEEDQIEYSCANMALKSRRFFYGTGINGGKLSMKASQI